MCLYIPTTTSSHHIASILMYLAFLSIIIGNHCCYHQNQSFYFGNRPYCLLLLEDNAPLVFPSLQDHFLVAHRHCIIAVIFYFYFFGVGNQTQSIHFTTELYPLTCFYLFITALLRYILYTMKFTLSAVQVDFVVYSWNCINITMIRF